MASNPYAQYSKPNPYAVYSTPGAGPKPSAGFAVAGGKITPQTFIPGGENDPVVIARRTSASAQAEQAAHVSAERQIIAMQAAKEWALFQKEHPDQGGPEVPSSDVHGPAYLPKIPDFMRGTVQSVVAGNLSPPTGTALKDPYWKAVLQHAINLDPSFAGQDFGLRAKTRNDFNVGPDGRAVTAANAALSHAKNVLANIRTLGNNGGLGTPLNGIENWTERQFGSDKQTNFSNDMLKYGSEMAKAYQNEGEGERDAFKKSVPLNGSPSQQVGALAHDVLFLKGKLDAYDQQYKRGMGPMNSIYDMLDPDSKDTMNQLLSVATGQKKPADLLVPPLPAARGNGGDTAGGAATGGGGSSGGGGAPTVSLATGKTRVVPSAEGSAIINAGIRSGLSDDQIDAALHSIDVPPIDRAGSAAARAYFAKNPGYKGSFGGATKVEDQSLFNRVSASPLGVGVGSAIDGSMGGLTDEATGLINAARGQGSVSDMIAQADAKKQAAYAANPRASTIGNILGTTTTALTGGLALKGTAAALAMGRAAPFVGAGIYGGISGAGQNNDNRVDGAGLGTIEGILGTAGGKALAVPVGALARTAPALAATNGVRRMFGRAGIDAPSLSPAEGDLFGAANKAGPDAIRATLDQASNLNVPMSLADTAPQLTSLGASAVRRSPTAAGIAESALLPRARGQIDRLGSAVTRDLGPIANIPQTSADLMGQAKAAAAPLYDAAYSAPGASSVKIDDLLTRPSFKNGLNQARNIALEEGRDPTALGFDLDRQGNVTLNRVPSFQTLDYVKRGLDDTLEPHRNPITGKLELNEATRAINSTKSDLLGRMDAVNPDYAAARKAYAGPAQARDALAAGQDSFSLSPDELAMQAGNQTPDNLLQMQLGQRSQLMNRANKVRDVSNPWEATLGTPNARGQIDALYPGNPGNANLFATRDMEGQIARSANDVLGNSKTAQRQIADQVFAGPGLGDMAGAAVDLAHGGIPVGTIAKAGLTRAGMFAASKRAVSKADDLAPMMFNTDPAASKATIDDLIARAIARSQYVQGMRPNNVMGYLGGGFGASAAQGF